MAPGLQKLPESVSMPKSVPGYQSDPRHSSIPVKTLLDRLLICSRDHQPAHGQGTEISHKKVSALLDSFLHIPSTPSQSSLPLPFPSARRLDLIQRGLQLSVPCEPGKLLPRVSYPSRSGSRVVGPGNCHVVSG